VPVRNDAARLNGCLRSIQASRAPGAAIDILVVDHGSTDGSADIARRRGIPVMTMSGGSVAALRNAGGDRAVGDVLAFVDADNEVDPGWTTAAVESLMSNGVGAVGALYDAPADATWVQRAYGYLRGRARGRRDAEWLASGNLAIRKDVFDEIGGFDPSLDTCEDVDLCNRIRSRGWRVLADARLRSVHYGDPRTLLDVFRGELWRGRDNLRVSFRRPISWSALPSAIVPVVDSVAMLGGVVAAFWAVRGSQPAVLLDALAVLALVGGALLKVARACVREGAAGVTTIQAFAVALVYDVARALALFARAAHRGAQRTGT
jgi:glycosyltransferase involved in cell wall biosynthesis